MHNMRKCIRCRSLHTEQIAPQTGTGKQKRCLCIDYFSALFLSLHFAHGARKCHQLFIYSFALGWWAWAWAHAPAFMHGCNCFCSFYFHIYFLFFFFSLTSVLNISSSQKLSTHANHTNRLRANVLFINAI